MFFRLLLSSACSALRLSVFPALLPQQVGRECTRSSPPLPQNCQVCSSHIFLLDYINWGPYILTLISGTHSSVYSRWFAATFPTPLKWFLFSDIFLCAHISPQVSLYYSSMLSSICGTGFGWSLLSSVKQSDSPHLCFDRSSLHW